MDLYTFIFLSIFNSVSLESISGNLVCKFFIENDEVRDLLLQMDSTDGIDFWKPNCAGTYEIGSLVIVRFNNKQIRYYYHNLSLIIIFIMIKIILILIIFISQAIGYIVFCEKVVLQKLKNFLDAIPYNQKSLIISSYV